MLMTHSRDRPVFSIYLNLGGIEMKKVINEGITLMPNGEYLCMRKKAIDILKKSQNNEEKICVVGKQKVLIKEKDVLLNRLIGGYEYLKVPIELYLTSEFWRTLKVESNNRIRFIKLQNL